MTGRVFLDMDGVLADFDKGAGLLLGTDNTYKWEFIHGTKAFWERLNAYPRFFASLPPTPDAHVLWSAVQHRQPIVLTALPKKDDHHVAAQKREWIARHFGKQAVIITCLTEEKPNFCEPGDVLVDDRAVNREEWRKRGGNFVLHESARKTIVELAALGYL